MDEDRILAALAATHREQRLEMADFRKEMAEFRNQVMDKFERIEDRLIEMHADIRRAKARLEDDLAQTEAIDVLIRAKSKRLRDEMSLAGWDGPRAA